MWTLLFNKNKSNYLSSKIQKIYLIKIDKIKSKKYFK